MTKSILIVDDESSIRNMLRMALEASNFKVDEAINAKSAHEKITQSLPDLVLLDWMMPGTSGVELVRRIREDSDKKIRQLPIIILTAKDDDKHSIQALDTGADDFISKPFSPKNLISRINALLRRFQLLNQVWGESVYVEDRTVDVHIRRLRKILEKYNVDEYIQTVRGVGYRFEPPSLSN